MRLNASASAFKRQHKGEEIMTWTVSSPSSNLKSQLKSQNFKFGLSGRFLPRASHTRCHIILMYLPELLRPVVSCMSCTYNLNTKIKKNQNYAIYSISISIQPSYLTHIS